MKVLIRKKNQQQNKRRIGFDTWNVIFSVCSLIYECERRSDIRIEATSNVLVSMKKK